ncbi:hypothetical protein, partial [Burkholderia sp. Ac-20344]|uniref:hypothetical protein n=1 Tax=Burkholderia sp. Ac-20344 TaxID=2703890 RepID=UPI00197BE558
MPTPATPRTGQCPPLPHRPPRRRPRSRSTRRPTYRFDAKRDGEVAIPSGLIAGRARPVDKVPNKPPGGDWLWRDA